MKRKLRVGAVALASTLFVSGGATVAFGANGPVVDDALAACISDKLGEDAPDVLTEEALASMTGTLTCNNKGVTTLDGLEHATGLTRVDLQNNNLTDFDALAGLAGLEFIQLDNNNIQALPADMSAMDSLSFLALHRDSSRPGGPGISSLEPLRAVDSLIFLNIEFHKVTDLSPLETSALGLSSIYASSNPLASFEPVANFTNLNRLWASGPAGTTEALDLTPINGLQKLQQLYINNRALTTADIEKLTDLPALNQLHLHDNHITDISSLAPYLERSPFQLYANRQTVTLDPVQVGEYTEHIVTNYDGEIVPLTGNENVAVTSGNVVSHKQAATNSFTWSNGETQWGANGRRFSGTFTQTATAFPGYTDGNLSEQCDLNWHASAIMNVMLPDYPNNGYLDKVKFTDGAPGILEIQHWVGKYGDGPLHWRIPFATEYAVENAVMTVTAGDNWEFADAPVRLETYQFFVQITHLDEDGQATFPESGYAEAVPATVLSDGTLVIEIGDLPAGSSMALSFDAINTDGLDPAKEGVYNIDSTVTADYIPGEGPETCVLPEEPTTDPEPTEDPTTDPVPTDDPTTDPEPTTDPAPTAEPTTDPAPTADPTTDPAPSTPGTAPDAKKPGGKLPRTGVSAGVLAGAALALAAAGGGFLALRRKNG